MTYFDSKNLFVDQPTEKGLSCAAELLNARSLLMDVFDSYLNGKKVIDLGCNNGRWSSYFLDKGATFVEGVDIDPTYIESAKVCMATYFSSDKYSFTVAFLCLGTHHIFGCAVIQGAHLFEFTNFDFLKPISINTESLGIFLNNSLFDSLIGIFSLFVLSM